MSDMEYRAYVRVPGLDVESDEAGELLRVLEGAGDLGPVLSGFEQGTEVTLATDATDPAHAASALCEVVADALVDAGLRSLYPAGIEVEPVTGELAHA